MNKTKGSFLVSALMALILSSCGGNGTSTGPSRKEISSSVVEGTCMSEGYTEHVMDDGYVYRDNFTPKGDHHYISFNIGGEDGIEYLICDTCGHLKYEVVEEDISTEVEIDRTRERPSFCNQKHMACAMILEENPENAIKAIRKAEKHGADGFMIYITALNPSFWNRNDIERIMYCTDKPIMALAYNGTFFGQYVGQTYEDMTALLKLSVECGAAAIDFQGYIFQTVDYDSVPADNLNYRSYWEEKGFGMSFISSNPKEVTLNPAVVERQQAFIKEIHDLGAEVEYSTHVNVQLTAEQILDLGKFAQAQNCDVSKIVCSGSSKETVIEHLKACILLENELDIKFSVHGQSTLSRLMAPMFGGYIAFCVDEYTTQQSNLQIDLATMVAILESPELTGNE